jgi:PAT family acetyl-CoA transporter-like MFS transporter 1
MVCFTFSLLFGIFYGIIIRWTALAKLPDGTHPAYYYAVILFVYALHQVTVYSMFVSLMAFHARISDPAIGGTYMTLLNTVTNLGGMWPCTVALWLLDFFKVSTCGPDQRICFFNCPTEPTGQCQVWIDGYYTETFLFIILGFIWLKVYQKRLLSLQNLPLSAWKLK